MGYDIGGMGRHREHLGGVGLDAQFTQFYEFFAADNFLFRHEGWVSFNGKNEGFWLRRGKNRGSGGEKGQSVTLSCWQLAAALFFLNSKGANFTARKTFLPRSTIWKSSTPAMSRLESVVQELKTHIGEGIEPALKFLEQVLSPGSDNYNDFIQIKGRYNSLQRELLLGTLDPAAYDKARNSISQGLLLLADTLQENDLKTDAGAPAPSADKRGEILYRIPDRMQNLHEEKCVVRLAWVLEHLLRDWEEAAHDVVKDIRMAEIMGVYLLNVDEHNPFAIRTISEPVQFVDKDDYTEWIFYVKPLLVGEFPLVLRVSVIEMINGKEYKKDIVLEEQIIVTSEEVPSAADGFKKADESLILAAAGEGARAASETQAKPPAPEAAEAPNPSSRRNLGKWLGIALSTVALATAGLFIGVPYYRDEMAWRNARQGGQRPDYEGYLSQYPEGRHRQAAIDSLRRYEMIGRDTLGNTSPTTPEEPVDSVIENLPVDSVQMDNPPTSPPVTLVIPKEKKPRKKRLPATPPKDKPANPPADKKPDPVVVKPPTPVVTSGIPSLSGIVAPFEMKPFSVVKNNGTEFQIKFLEHNEKGQALVTLAGKGDWVMRQEQELVFVLNGGDMVKAKLAYVAKA